MPIVPSDVGDLSDSYTDKSPMTTRPLFVVDDPGGVIVRGLAQEQTTAGVDVYVSGTGINIPIRYFKPGRTLKWSFCISKTAAGTATPIWTVRVGTKGTIADTARLTFTSSVQTADIDVATVELTVGIKTTGALGVLVGTLIMHHNGDTTGFGNVGRPQILNVTSSAFSTITTTGWKVGISVNPGTSGVWTFQNVSATFT